MLIASKLITVIFEITETLPSQFKSRQITVYSVF